MTLRRAGIALHGTCGAVLLAGCSLLVHFDDAPGDAGSDATGVPEGATDTGADAGAGEGGGPSGACATEADGTYCGYLGGCQCAYCSAGACAQTKACPQGFNWEAGVDEARCCNGLPILTNTNANCGVCGAQCATAGVTGVQNCALLAGHYQCVDCAANNECWTGCCAIDTTPYHCSESNCATGACVAGLCPAPSTCVEGSGTPNYCTYD